MACPDVMGRAAGSLRLSELGAESICQKTSGGWMCVCVWVGGWLVGWLGRGPGVESVCSVCVGVGCSGWVGAVRAWAVSRWIGETVGGWVAAWVDGWAP